MSAAISVAAKAYTSQRVLMAALAGLTACGRCSGDRAKPAPVLDAGVVTTAPAPPGDAWPELADFGVVTPVSTATVPSLSNGPRFDVAGPVLVGDVAVVATSTAGFVGIDLGSGLPRWTRAAGAHMAPPVARGGVILLGECPEPVESSPADRLLGCLTVVDPARGVDVAAAIVRGARADVDGFAAAVGPQRVRRDGDALIWQRGDAAVRIDVASGRAAPTAPLGDGIDTRIGDQRYRWAIEDEVLIARGGGGAELWRMRRRAAALVGLFAAEPPQAPMVRVVAGGLRGNHGAFTLLDVEALEGSQGAAATSVPGIQVLATGFGPHGATALAIRLDSSLRRDYIAAFDGNAVLLWVWPLPVTTRIDPVGLAVDERRVVVFHDGDRLTVLPLSWEDPTPAATRRAPSENSTP